MDDSTTTFSPLPSRFSLGGGGGRGGGRPSVGGLLQDENMSLAVGGDYDLDDEADADPFQLAPGQARDDDDDDDEPTVRFDGSAGGGGQKPPAKSSADLFFGGSMAASTSSRGTTGAAGQLPHSGVGGGGGSGGPLGSSSILAPGLRSPALASPRSSIFAPAAAATAQGAASSTRTSGTAAAAQTENRGSSYEPDEDDLTDSALESRGLAPEELARVRSLRDERDGLRTMNAVLEDVLGALKLTEGKMENFQATIDTSHQLLDLYARIASQAEHTKDLLLDGEWQGVERDYEFLAAREQAAREAEEAALREAEEQAAREEAERVRKAQEEQWRRDQAERAVASSSAGAGRGAGRGGVAESPRQRLVRRSSRFLRPLFFATTTPNNNNNISTDNCFLPRRLLPQYILVNVWDPDTRCGVGIG
ncbi:hypothetical protein RHOSPDRAFT_34118 [Rhodotorula sp. JG-1b]|nr:hypothetical protein RHOSPDRAFT_34118 [Rhodotorula sp. JG-1b]